jgi:hypothetical protein
MSSEPGEFSREKIVEDELARVEDELARVVNYYQDNLAAAETWHKRMIVLQNRVVHLRSWLSEFK